MTYHLGPEDVSGTIIGDMPPYYRYKFYTDGGTLIHYNWLHYDTDAEAVAWFSKNYPDHFKRGVEMRRWDN